MLKSREAHSRQGGAGGGAAIRPSGIHKRSIASSDRQVMSRHARRERDRHRERERKGDCIDRLLEQPIDTEQQRQQIALMSHTRLRSLQRCAGSREQWGEQLISMEPERASWTRAPRTQITEGIRIVWAAGNAKTHLSLSPCCSGISVGSRQKTSNVASLSGTHKFFLGAPAPAAPPPPLSQIYAILSALPKHCSNFFRCLSFAFCFNHPEPGAFLALLLLLFWWIDDGVCCMMRAWRGQCGKRKGCQASFS